VTVVDVPTAGDVRRAVDRLVGYREAFEFAAISAALTAAFVLQFLDRTLPQYVDESDNLLGGRLIARGYRLYVDYFSHHMPLPYYVAAVGTRLGLNDLVGYRALFSVLVVLALGYICLHFRRRISPIFLVVLVISVGICHPMFWGYMLLADHLFAFALLAILVFLLVVDVDATLPEQVAVSLCCFVAVQSALISLYPLLLVAVYYVVRKAYRYLRGGPRTTWKREGVFVAILLAPHLLLALWLVAQGSAGDLVDQAFRFNQVYYSRYDLGDNPVAILAKSFSDFKDVAVQYLRLGSLREVETVLLVSNIAAVFVVWKKRDLLFAVFYVGLVILARMRAPGYHGSPYFLVSFASIAVVVSFAVDGALDVLKRSREHLFTTRKVLLGLALLGYLALVGVFYHDVAGFYRRLPRGVGDTEDVATAYATIVDAATAPDDRIWAAPDEPYVYLKANRLPASRYWFYHPWLADSSEITEGVLRDLQTAQPALIVFRADKEIPWMFPLPTPREFGARVYAFIRAGYVALDDQDPVLRDVFVRRDRLDVVRTQLEQRGIMQPPRHS
jgi:hypothetical protein